MLFGFGAGMPARAVCAIAFALVSGQAFGAPLMLEEAFRIAEDANPAIRNARAAIHAAEGQLSESRALLFNNPEVSLEQSRTRIPSGAAPGERFNAWTAGISQSFELGGQQGLQDPDERHRCNACDLLKSLHLCTSYTEASPGDGSTRTAISRPDV